jgi:hypothetical protein
VAHAIPQEVEPRLSRCFETGVSFAGEKNAANDVFGDLPDVDGDSLVGDETDVPGEGLVDGGGAAFEDKLALFAVVAFDGEEVNDEPDGISADEGFFAFGIVGQLGTDATGDIAAGGEIKDVEPDGAHEFLPPVNFEVVVLVVKEVGLPRSEADAGGEDGRQEGVGVLATEASFGDLEGVGFDFVEIAEAPSEGVAVAAVGGIDGRGGVAGDAEFRIGGISSPIAELLKEEFLNGGRGVVAGDLVVEAVDVLDESGAAVAFGGFGEFATGSPVEEAGRAVFFKGVEFVVDGADGDAAAVGDELDDGSLGAGAGDQREIVEPRHDLFEQGGAGDFGEEIGGHLRLRDGETGRLGEGERFEGGRDALDFGVYVLHGRLKALVSEDLLHVADAGSGVDGVGCPGVAEMVGGENAGETGALAGFSHGFLDSGVEAMPPDADGAGLVVGIDARVGGGEDPEPSKLTTGAWIFGSVAVREFGRDALGHGPIKDALGGFDLTTERSNEGRRDGDDAIFGPFGLANEDSALGEVDVANAEIQGLGNAQPAAVKKRDDEMERINGGVADFVEHGADLLASRGVSGELRATGTEGIDLTGVGLEDVAIEKEQGVECLILSGRGTTGFGEIRKERFHAGSGRKREAPALAQVIHEATQPVGVTFAGGYGIVTHAEDALQFSDGFDFCHFVVGYLLVEYGKGGLGYLLFVSRIAGMIGRGRISISLAIHGLR